MDKEWLVSDKACKGCKYYGFLGAARWCMYTYDTGRIRQNPPGKCEVKSCGRRLAERRDISIISGKSKKRKAEKDA